MSKGHGTIEVTSQVWIDDILDDIEDDDLLQLVLDRFGPEKAGIGIIKILKKMGCPDLVMQPIQTWLKEPVVTKERLNAWKELCSTNKAK